MFRKSHLPNSASLPDGPALRNRCRPFGLARTALAAGVFALSAGLDAKAGNILRMQAPAGSSPVSSTTGNPTANSTGTSQSKLPGTSNNILARNTQALQAVQAMQNAAHQIALKGPNNLGVDPNHPGLQLPNVPNGLGLGGLQVAKGVPVNLSSPISGEDPTLWQGASLPTQTVSQGHTTVNIRQSAPQALLNWETFNVGKETTLNFDQSAGGAASNEWIAFNKINDPSGIPSQILGSIQGIGQVYVINQNGILFGGSSQVNLHSLVASSLPINDNLVSRGLLNNPDFQFLFSALPIDAGVNGTPAFTPPPLPNTATGQIGDVVVQPGAMLSSPTTADHVGGRIMLIGPNVKNEGSISTPDGQTILAAGLQVGLVAHPSTDPSLRGLDVYVGAVTAPTPVTDPSIPTDPTETPSPDPTPEPTPPPVYAGTATNSGLIDAERADVTMAGKTVEQLGFINSSTSVALNGRVDLLADYNTLSIFPSSGSPFFTPTATGVVTLGAGSVTQILPELADTSTVVGTALALSSQVNVQGLTVHLGSSAQILAPSAQVSIETGNWINNVSLYPFVSSAGQIYLDQGAQIDVSGSQDVLASVLDNIISVQLRGTELADSPLQRNSALRGQTVQIDVRETGTYNGQAWVGTPLANAFGYVGLIQRNVGELTTTGGTVTLNAGDSVVLQTGSSINVSGGWINYQGGNVQTTRVVSEGHVFDISQATPNRIYGGIFAGFTKTSAKWGVTQTFSGGLTNGSHYEAGYVQGGNGGSISITAPTMALDGNLQGNTVTGPRQRTIAPVSSSLSLNFKKADLTSPSLFAPLPAAPSIIFQSGVSLSAADPFALDESGNPLPLREDRQASVILSPDLVGSAGFGILKIDNNDGDITVPAGVELTSPVGGSITLLGANIDVEGKVSAPSGSLGFTAYDLTPNADPPQTAPIVDPARGLFTLGATASLNVAGIITDDRLTSPTINTGPISPSGGSITINSFNANLLTGSSINASGGVTISSTGKLAYGTGGSISISAGRDPGVAYLLGGQLTLASSLQAYSGVAAGALTIQAPLIQIGGTVTTPGTFLISPDFLNQGGFGKFTFNGIAQPIPDQAEQYLPGLVVAPGTILAPIAESWQGMLDSGGPGTINLTPVVLPEALRTPVSLTFKAVGVTDGQNNLIARGDAVIGAGAVITTDAKGSVSVSGDTVEMLGAINAPGGTISISGGKTFAAIIPPLDPLPTVDLGPSSSLSVAGTTLLTPNAFGYRTGSVLAGGSISVSGNIVAEAGSILNVSGASDILDFLPAYSGDFSLTGNAAITTPIPTRVDSNAGSITFTGSQELFADATLLGKAGGPSALGGSLTISSGRFIDPANPTPPTPLDPTLIISQNTPAISTLFYPAGGSVIGNPVVDADGNIVAGLGYFAADHFVSSGLDALTLNGTVQFSGPVTISAARSIIVGNGGVILADSTVNLSAPYVSLGTPFQAPVPAQPAPISAFLANGQPFFFSPSYGPGNLNVNASLIDIGNLSLQGIGNASFTASNGDIRGNGTLDVAGAITMTAGQIYPPTAVSFTINASDKNITVATSNLGDPAVTLASPILPPGFGIGSALLGSTVQSIDGANVTLAEGADASLFANTLEVFDPGSGTVTIRSSGNRQLPLSAGGTLNIYAANIIQGGVLRAPLGTINLGSSITGTTATDLISGQPVTPTQYLTLTPGSITSVSAVDPTTGQSTLIPYGTNLNGTAWIDPSGTDIFVNGVPNKVVNLSAVNVADEAGSLIDLSGGGDLYAYRWVPGTGGSQDILASTSSFAVIPNYDANYSPYDPGYSNSTLSVGDQIYLNASEGLSAGFYTLLPARYALLPGAFLVTPQNSTPVAVTPQPDGSSIVSGYRFNNLSVNRTGQPLFSSFEVAPEAVVRSRAEYDDSFGNSYLAQAATGRNIEVPRLPVDAGQAVLAASLTMSIDGRFSAKAGAGGLGSLVDISSPSAIYISNGGQGGPEGSLTLDSTTISNIGASSLLIGGFRKTGTDGTIVTVTTGDLTVDNAGAPLAGPDVILVANNSLTLAPGAEVVQSGALSSPASLILLGDSTVAGSGNGILLRVSSDPTAQSERSGLDASTAPSLIIGAGAKITGSSVILDSTSATTLDPTAIVSGTSVSINCGQISLQLDNPGDLQPTTGIVISQNELQTLQASAQNLSLLSYSSIDLYGTGAIGSTAASSTLALHAAGIRGFNQGDGTATIEARNITIDNSLGAVMPVIDPTIDPTVDPVLLSGTLAFNADTVQLTAGAGTFSLESYNAVNISAPSGIEIVGAGGLQTSGALNLITSVITGATGASQTITAGGALTITGTSATAGTPPEIGLGAKLTLVGSTVAANGSVLLPSGSLTLHATTGDLSVGGNLDTSGTEQTFQDLIQYTSGGQISLISDAGSVIISSGGKVSVAAQSGGGNAGSLTVSAITGSFALGGSLFGQGGVAGKSGTFSLDVGSLPALGALDQALDASAFSQSWTIRVRTGDVLVDGLATTQNFSLSTDLGSITVTGTIDVSGLNGGTIGLYANENLTLAGGAVLNASGQTFDAAGKGGSVDLETRGVNAGQIDLQTGSTIDLSVSGGIGGKLHLRAPQTADNTDLQIATIQGSILNASSIVVEGYQIYDLTDSGGQIDSVEADVNANGITFAGSPGTTTDSYTAMLNRLAAGNPTLTPVLSIQPGAEIINTTGDLTLSSNWDLSTYRYGPDNAPGVLTLRAAGNLNFAANASLSDGFDGLADPSLWQAPLLAPGSLSWSYRLIAGADFSSVDFHAIQPLDTLVDGTGSLLIGVGEASLPVTTNNNGSSIIPNYYQVIRTGTGDIDIAAARDVQLLNSLATIYTAGTQAEDLTNFDQPSLNYKSNQLGTTQTPIYPAQYSFDGGNVTITAQNDIARYNVDDSTGVPVLVADSSKEMPDNWLYRRGFVDPTTGQFSVVDRGAGGGVGEIASTSWWVDFSNFFEGVGALGGGNVTMLAGHDVSNVDAAIPTNARMPQGTPDASQLVELGGGNLLVRAGNDINGGVYYVERGQGTLDAGHSILTNVTRAALTQGEISNDNIQGIIPDASTWLPTTLFVGKSSFEVTAGADLLLGPVANPFLLPQGIDNSFYEKTYFSTYSSTASVTASSLTGSVTLQNNPTGSGGSLANWYQNVLLYYQNPQGFSASQPWLRLAETDTTAFGTVTTLMPGTLRLSAFSGDLNLVGNITLSPSAQGTIDLAAAGSINGLQKNSAETDNGTFFNTWSPSTINLSDADPNSLPGVATPLSLSVSSSGFQGGAWNFTQTNLFDGIDSLFNESGSTAGTFGVLQTKQALHAPGILHADDPNPVHLYADSGDISGLTLFSGKAARVIAGNDLTDIALYIQNDQSTDVTVVSAGRDIIAYDPNSTLRLDAQATGNQLTSSASLAGDIQITGPGTLEVLAGRNLDLGVGPNNTDGTGVGITSIGNARNPYLPFAGADIIAGAGIGISSGLSSSALDVASFTAQFLNPTSGGMNATRYLPQIATLLGLASSDPAQIWTAFTQSSPETQARLALDIFYLVLRDAGRDHNDSTSATFGTYTNGYAAIAALFPGNIWKGDLSLTSREIKTASGGDISLFAPGGQLTVGFDIAGNQAADQGILTQDGGNISIFTDQSVIVGTSRIFTLRGGNEIIWSTTGNIAAGASSKTVQSAPPTRVLIDPQSANVQTDLAGLATGGGIGVLETVTGIPSADVDLIAPTGTIDAGDAGIRATGNLNVAAVQILNASNIQVGGSTVGTPAVVVPNIGAIAAASSSSASQTAASTSAASAQNQHQASQQDLPSIIVVEVLGYGGGDGG